MTVSRAFKEDASVNKETRHKILKAADELGYVFDSTASNLRSQKTGFVAVTIPSLNNSNFADTVTALSDELADQNLQSLLGYTNYSLKKEEELIEQFLKRRPEAIVVTGHRHSKRAHSLLEKAKIPVIEMWDQPSSPTAHSVGFSNSAAMRDLTAQLIKLGHTELAFIGGGPDSDTRAQDRRNGFLQAVSDHGLAPSRLINTSSTNLSIRESLDAMAELMVQYKGTKTILCASDLYAFGALSFCQREGIQVPKTMAIAGFGAFEIAACACPTITTVDAKPHEIGQKTASLISALRNNPTSNLQSVNTPYQILLRETTDTRF